MLSPEETVKLINLVKDQPLLYVNFNFSVDIDQQIEVLKLETWENISKTMNMESKCFVSLISIVSLLFAQLLRLSNNGTKSKKDSSMISRLATKLQTFTRTVITSKNCSFSSVTINKKTCFKIDKLQIMSL